MSTQYTDDSFSTIENFKNAQETFQEALDKGTAKALHVGKKEELLERMKSLQRFHSGQKEKKQK